MSVRGARIVALPVAVAAFALRLLHTLWLTPVTWQVEAGIGSFLLWLAGLAASLALPLGGYVLLTRQFRHRPATMRCDGPGRRFVVPATPHWAGLWAVVLGWLAAGLVLIERVPNENRMRLAAVDYSFLLSVMAVLIGLGMIATLCLLYRPDLTLDPETITVRRLLKTVRIRWTELRRESSRSVGKHGQSTMNVSSSGHSQWY